MQAKTQSVLAITNLYPVPWAVHRASFNKQQFDVLEQNVPLRILVLLPWTEWFKNRKQCAKSDNLNYAPYFYFPGFGRILTPAFQFVAIMFKQRWINNSKPDHIIASWAFPDAIACLIYSSLFGQKVLVKAHGTDINENTRFATRRWLMRLWLNKADSIFCASNALANKLIDIGINADIVCTNYNGVNKSVFFPDNSSHSQPLKKLIFIGSLIKTKGIFELLSAIRQLVKTQPIFLQVIGQGPSQTELQQFVQTHKLEQYVSFSGSLPLPEVALQLRTAKLLVLPSYREGVPNVLLEAFASGVPVVASAVGGIPEVVNDKVGLLCAAQNIESLTISIEKALVHPWSKSDILAHAAQFDWSVSVARLTSRINK